MITTVPRAEFKRRCERFISAYNSFLSDGKLRNLFPYLFQLCDYCLFRRTSDLIKHVKHV